MHPRISRALALSIALSGMAGCATGGPPGPSMDYACADGSRIGVGYPSDDIIRVRTSAGRNLVLTRTETASGVRFTDGQHNIWNKGDDIMWSEGSTQDALLCRKG